MNPVAKRLGFWSAVGLALASILYPIYFIAILASGPMFLWDDLAGYVAYSQQYGSLLQPLSFLTALLMGPLLVVLLNSIYDYAPATRRILVRISIVFGGLFAALIGINYMIQLTAVPASVEAGELEGLGQFVMSNPVSAVLAINMLGWTLFLGLAALFVAPVFTGGRLERVISGAFWATGGFCLLGGVGFVLRNALMIFLTITLGMGAALLVAALGLSLLFRRMPSTVPQPGSQGQ